MSVEADRTHSQAQHERVMIATAFLADLFLCTLPPVPASLTPLMCATIRQRASCDPAAQALAPPEPGLLASADVFWRSRMHFCSPYASNGMGLRSGVQSGLRKCFLALRSSDFPTARCQRQFYVLIWLRVKTIQRNRSLLNPDIRHDVAKSGASSLCCLVKLIYAWSSALVLVWPQLQAAWLRTGTFPTLSASA